MPDLVDMGSRDAAAEVADSLVNSGFAAITNHAIPLQDLLDFYSAWDDFFTTGKPEDYATDAASQAGYFSRADAETAKGAAAQDIKEYFQYWPWGPVPPALKTRTASYYESVYLLACRILEGLQQNTPEKLWQRLECPLKDCLSRSETMLRVLRYPPMTGNEPDQAIRAGAHEDINFITLLPVASRPGLEIRPGDQDWQAVDAPPGTIIINIGDMLQELTRGALPSTPHRVVNPTGADRAMARLTAPLFCHPYPAMRLSDRYTAAEYLLKRLREISPEAVRPS